MTAEKSVGGVGLQMMMNQDWPEVKITDEKLENKKNKIKKRQRLNKRGFMLLCNSSMFEISVTMMIMTKAD